MTAYQHIVVPAAGEAIKINANHSLSVPHDPIIPYIEGDGTGVDITPVMLRVVDAAVQKAYVGRKKIHWMEVYAGDKAVALYGPGESLPKETLQALREHVVFVKGPLATPVGGGLRSLNMALRQALDLYVSLRPVQYFPGVPSPLKEPDKTNMVIFRENSEDIYAGIEFSAGSREAGQLIDFLTQTLNVTQIRFPQMCGIGIKPVSQEGSERLVRKAIEYAIANDRASVTFVHKGNIMKFTEGAFRDWGYALAQKEFGAKPIDNGPWCSLRNPKTGREIIIKDVIADSFLQQILLRPKEYSVIATLNLNGDYITDALAAQVGGSGIAPSANLSDTVACFEATHGSAPKYAGKDVVNPTGMLLSTAMLLEHIGETKASERLISAIRKCYESGVKTKDVGGTAKTSEMVETIAASL